MDGMGRRYDALHAAGTPTGHGLSRRGTRNRIVFPATKHISAGNIGFEMNALRGLRNAHETFNGSLFEEEVWERYEEYLDLYEEAVK
ncbi:hypothetical protein E2C01_005681 [Portunus trituberculatus]|uniref:Uncharacterized protein n=1 Tax=Portunus trituberculatus TaxID=210409 RepID=A0A5B7CW50_PORTR|nr:hypothetical protein [Portunus trituberculatus]